MSGYISTKTIEDRSNLYYINDAQRLYNFAVTNNNVYKPPLLERTYQNFYEFILTNGERKIRILDTTINESHINEIVSNKSLLYKVYISQNCVSIMNNTFKDCSNLTFIDYSNLNANNSLINIGASAFENCSNLEECRLFDISNIINNIADYAFKNCQKLYEIQLEKSMIETIGVQAFYNCSSLVTIKFPTSIKNIGSNAFLETQLTNIHFLNVFPNGTLGTDIFAYSAKSICYYNSTYINGSTYISLKNLFPINNLIFVNTLNNSLENANTNFMNITNNGVNVTIVNDAINVLKTIIIKSPSNYNITISYDNTLIGTSTLGYANWSQGSIALNPDNNTGSNIYLNNTLMSLNSVVLIHEILHILGYGSGTLWNNYSKYSVALDYYFTGSNAIYQYNKILFRNGYKKKLDYVTREDSGGSGTIGSHLEEGFFIESNYFNPQMRADSKGNVYPSLSDEIMSGYLGYTNYFTYLSCGVLQDLGYSINYNSPNIFNGAIKFYPDVSLNSIVNLTNDLTNDLALKNAKYKIKCNCEKNENFITSICSYIN